MLPTLPEDIANRCFDALGYGGLIGSMGDGTKASEVLRRSYGPTLRQLLRTAHWGFARKQAALLLLGDSSGATLDPGSGQPISMAVEQPWLYAYSWPSDCVAARWLPWNQTANGLAIPPAQPVLPPNAEQTQAPWTNAVPARFLLSTSDQFPAEVGQVDWDNLPDLGEGQGAINRRVILTNVQYATLVYTALILEPDLWDPLFQEGMVAGLAARSALAVLVDTTASMADQAKQRMAAMAVRNAQIAIAKNAITEARVASANEAGFPQSVAHTPDWIRRRQSGGYGWGDIADGPGYYWCGFDGFGFGGASVF